MHMHPRFLILAIVFAAVLAASSPAFADWEADSVEWDGDPSVASSDPGSGYGTALHTTWAEQICNTNEFWSPSQAIYQRKYKRVYTKVGSPDPIDVVVDCQVSWTVTVSGGTCTALIEAWSKTLELGQNVTASKDVSLTWTGSTVTDADSDLKTTAETINMTTTIKCEMRTKSRNTSNGFPAQPWSEAIAYITYR